MEGWARKHRLDRHRPHGLRDGRAPRQGRRRRHRLEPHARQGRAAGASTARRSPTRLTDLAGCDIVFVHGLDLGRREGSRRRPGRAAVRPARRRSMVVECSSISLEGSAELRALLAARGVEMLAAPVSGNAKVIKAGQLSFVCSGPKAAFDAAAPFLQADRAGGELCRRGRARAHRQDLPQRLPRRRDPVARRNHGARAEGRRAAARVPRLHEPERDGLDVLALQDAGVRQPRFQGHVHAEAAAQGPRPRARCRRGASRCRCRSRRSRATSCRR